MRYAITGATGFVGEALARRLAADGHDVVATVRTPAKAADLAELGVDVRQADLDDVAAMTEAFRGCDGVFHVAGWYKVGDPNPEEGWRVNVEGTKNALAAAAAAQVPRLVYTSTLAVNSHTDGRTVDETYRFTGRHRSTYDETKARAHEYVEQYAATHAAPEIVTVMPGGIYGPGDTSTLGALLADVAVGKRVMVSSSLRMMQAYVDDIADGHVLAMERGRAGESYMLAGERSDLRSVVTEMAALVGGPKPIDMPLPVLIGAEKAMGLISRVVTLPTQFNPEALRAAQCSYLGTPAKAQKELGWTFRPLHEGLRDTALAEGWIS